MEDAQLVRRVCSKCSTNGQNTTRLAVCFGMALVGLLILPLSLTKGKVEQWYQKRRSRCFSVLFLDKPNATSRGIQEEEEEQEQQQQQQQRRARGWRNCTRSLARALNES
ncbi:hypothetical protein V1477_007426 [Vespula maculifrons]|uniref:Uncharacterized protein n=1 Tax=Vespula maculifrons TaxID=7453 RepID=A0ABD2CJJ9_VESMC